MSERQEDLTGRWAVCSIGRIGRIEGRKMLEWGESWVGTGLDGEPWASRTPRVLRDDQVALLRTQEQGPTWQPISTAPKDGTAVLLMFKPDAASWDAMGSWAGIAFVGRNRGDERNWNFAAPVGVGGFGDDSFAGWMPLPTPPQENRDD
ncbi:MAG: hypothetical protein AMXMBFR53_30180 [Gemmatimonadota bacterium]